MSNFKYYIIFCLLSLSEAVFVLANAGNVYYVSPTGSDANSGTITAPFATLNKAHTMVTPGDTVYFRGGTYLIDPSQIMTPASTTGTGQYTYVFDLNKKGNATSGRIVYAGYPGERPVFDFSQILPQTRIVAFYLHANYVHIKNFDIVGIKATMHGHYQCECVAARNGSYCITENIAMHDNMAIGYYATKGSNNLVLNCDAYNNYDDYSAFKNDSLYTIYKTTGSVPSGSTSETLGGNCDGFGFHATRDYDTCNVFRGCRAWWNSDDGFDCINSKTVVVWDSCWAFYNGYEPGTNTKRGDGNGFKAGGYGMSTPASNLPGEGYDIPMNVISNCIAFYNKTNGFYANHHLGGNLWENNTAMWNWKNFDFTNRKEANTTGTAQDTKGYGHIIRRNVSFAPQDGSNKDARHFSTIDSAQCILENNAIAVASDFLDCTRLSYTKLAKIALCNPRQADGSLPYTPFLRAAATGSLYANHQGALFEYVPDDQPTPTVSAATGNAQYDPSQPVYTLLGQRVTTPPCSGVYIQNGNKLVINK